MRPRFAVTVVLATLLALGAGTPDEPKSDDALPTKEKKAEARDALSTSEAVACRSIDGYERYEVLPGASLTAEEKLLVYYRPLNYRVEETGGKYQIHLTQDGQIRRRGEKAVLLRKEKLLDCEFKTDQPPTPVFLRNTIALKGLKPGDYEFDIILHDKLGENRSVTHSLSFTIVPVVLPKPETDASDPEPRPAPAPKGRTKAKRGQGKRSKGA